MPLIDQCIGILTKDCWNEKTGRVPATTSFFLCSSMIICHTQRADEERKRSLTVTRAVSYQIRNSPTQYLLVFCMGGLLQTGLGGAAVQRDIPEAVSYV